MGDKWLSGIWQPQKTFCPHQTLHRCHRTGLPLWAGISRRLLATRIRQRSAGWGTLFVLSVSGCCWDSSHCFAGLLAPPSALTFCWGLVGVPLGFFWDSMAFCCHSSHIAMTHFSVKGCQLAALPGYFGGTVGGWPGLGMEGTGTWGLAVVEDVWDHIQRYHTCLACWKVGRQPLSLFGGRIIQPVPEAPCLWQALRGGEWTALLCFSKWRVSSSKSWWTGSTQEFLAVLFCHVLHLEPSLAWAAPLGHSTPTSSPHPSASAGAWTVSVISVVLRKGSPACWRSFLSVSFFSTIQRWNRIAPRSGSWVSKLKGLGEVAKANDLG